NRAREEAPVLSWHSAPTAPADKGHSLVPTAKPSHSTLTVVFIAWLAGFVVCLLPVIAGLWQLRLLRRSALAWREGQDYVHSIAKGWFIRRRIDVVRHKCVTSPMPCGILRPTIVLPMDAPDWTEQELRRALVHEIEHVRRADWLTLCVARAVCAVYCFHPLVW